MKYYVLLIIGVNMIVNIFIEWFVMKFVRTCYENKLIEDYKREVEEEKIYAAQNNNNNNSDNVDEMNKKEAPIFKHQRIYYYDRRNKKEKKNEQKKDDANDIDIYSSKKDLAVVS